VEAMERRQCKRQGKNGQAEDGQITERDQNWIFFCFIWRWGCNL
jgi:hypothetical protein